MLSAKQLVTWCNNPHIQSYVVFLFFNVPSILSLLQKTLSSVPMMLSAKQGSNSHNFNTFPMAWPGGEHPTYYMLAGHSTNIASLHNNFMNLIQFWGGGLYHDTKIIQYNQYTSILIHTQSIHIVSQSKINIHITLYLLKHVSLLNHYNHDDAY